jgi:RimJ/RimL family protein N-acetyltransferase
MTDDLQNWTSRTFPARHPLDGRYVRLEPLDVAVHGEGLFSASSVSDAADRFKWLPDTAPGSRPDFQPWLDKAAESVDPLYFAIIDKATGLIAGRQSLMAIDAANGSIEIGHIYWGPLMSRRPAATEAFFLFADYAFSDLGYRRFQWRCNNRNEPSKRAALRFGFQPEGVFRQHMVIKGENRDTAWFSIIDSEWLGLRAAFRIWLAPSNFDKDGQQVRRLEQIRLEVTKSE